MAEKGVEWIMKLFRVWCELMKEPETKICTNMRYVNSSNIFWAHSAKVAVNGSTFILLMVVIKEVCSVFVCNEGSLKIKIKK